MSPDVRDKKKIGQPAGELDQFSQRQDGFERGLPPTVYRDYAGASIDLADIRRDMRRMGSCDRSSGRWILVLLTKVRCVLPRSTIGNPSAVHDKPADIIAIDPVKRTTGEAGYTVRCRNTISAASDRKHTGRGMRASIGLALLENDFPLQHRCATTENSRGVSHVVRKSSSADHHNEVRLAVCSLSGDAPFSTYETASTAGRK